MLVRENSQNWPENEAVIFFDFLKKGVEPG